ncbi:serine/threonine protein kinase [Archangium sp.]|uniref:serine/threonine protein kinase n=1 Tax=Archangium sp. TaxID=1872627 RepID=UPI00286CAA5A|nr:serine/threonine protein kinase [Archangium sp.]
MPPLNALLLSAIVLLMMTSGCTTTGGVALRPDGTPGPQDCPEEAKTVMRALKLRVGDAAWVDLDANQLDARQLTLYDGPIESMLSENLGTLESTTRLYGQVWTSGAQIVIRYYEAHPPDNEKFPICAVARLSREQMRKRPESKPGMAILDGSTAAAYIVDAFR